MSAMGRKLPYTELQRSAKSGTSTVRPLDAVITMTSSTSCPSCSSSLIERSMQGGLFVDRCPVCGWEETGTYGPTIEDMPCSLVHRVSVRWGNQKIAPHALRVLRTLSPAAKRMSLVKLSEMMAGGRAFELGVVVEHRLTSVLRELADAGYTVISEVIP